LTNVTGGAFTPDVNTKENRLVFTNYDEKGYGIYLLDTVKTLEESLRNLFLSKEIRFRLKLLRRPLHLQGPIRIFQAIFSVPPSSAKKFLPKTTMFSKTGALKRSDR